MLYFWRGCSKDSNITNFTALILRNNMSTFKIFDKKAVIMVQVSRPNKEQVGH